MSFDNAANDNTFNAKRARSAAHQIKALLKTLLRRRSRPTYKAQPQPEFYADEAADNTANELLENEIFEECDTCEDLAGVAVYRNGHMDIMPVFRGQRYIPVHFARTQAGTFFWTSMANRADCDVISTGDAHPITQNQLPQLQVDRWAQA